MVEAGTQGGPRKPPPGRKRELDGIDWYEVETATLYEVWPEGEFGGEVEVLSRATGAPQIYRWIGTHPEIRIQWNRRGNRRHIH